MSPSTAGSNPPDRSGEGRGEGLPVTRWEWFLLTGFGSGLVPKAPGTAGSVVGAAIGGLAVLLSPTPNLTVGLLGILAAVVGIKLVNKYEENGGVHDDKRIVIDEIAGILVGLALLRWGDGGWDWVKLGLTFIGFRVMDIWKPSIIGKVDREAPKGWGVVGDDLLAGVFGALLGGILYEGVVKGARLLGL